ncbi:MAG: ATP synthase F1 subunit delta [Gemmatimonadota bacterium]
MQHSIVARSYAEALFEVAEREGEHDTYAAAFAALGELLGSDPRVRRFLATPNVQVAAKKDALRMALDGRVPARFLNFVLLVLDRRRQALLDAMGREYGALLDAKHGRMHVQVTLAHEPDEATRSAVASELTRIMGKQVVPHVRVDSDILGGLIARYEDRVLDLSLQRRLLGLRRRLLRTALPTGA